MTGLLSTNKLRNQIIMNGNGCKIQDSQGKEYLDFYSGVGCNILGYNHSKFTSILKKQTNKLIHIGSSFITVEITEALQSLNSILPPHLTNVTFLNSGSECVELALKIARAFTKKKWIIGFERGYYGATIHAYSLSEPGKLSEYVPKDNSPRMLAPYCYHCPVNISYPSCNFKCLHKSLECINEITKGENIAAIIFEPILSWGGIIIPLFGYFQELTRSIKKWGALLIADEVTTGMGRTGKWFAFEYDEIKPDILVIGKALGNGFPVGVVATTSEINNAIKGRFQHIQSHQNDPFSAKVVSTVIDIIKNEDLLHNCQAMGDYLLNQIKKLKDQYPVIADVRGRGLMIGMELDSEGKKDFSQLFYEFLYENGLILNICSDGVTFRMLPPYIITQKDIDFAVERIKKSLDQALSQTMN
ncbi:MAG: aspartate aminotransferase family protein [Acidobacteriota bacterium]